MLASVCPGDRPAQVRAPVATRPLNTEEEVAVVVEPAQEALV